VFYHSIPRSTPRSKKVARGDLERVEGRVSFGNGQEGEDRVENEGEVVGTLQSGGGKGFKVCHESLSQRSARFSLDAACNPPMSIEQGVT
jgi:hypothetical protein